VFIKSLLKTMIALINKTSFYDKTVELSSKQALKQKSGAVAKASVVVRAQKVDVARRRSATAAGVLAAGAAALTIAITPAQPAMAYDLANIVNSTNYNASGKVSYAVCSSDNYTVTPNTRWYANSRGACLLTKVTAIVKTPRGDVEATSYTSSGTSYASFAVISVGDNVFEVTRRVT
jgi:hypothetical protein